jgi:hypothetical protein
MRGYGGCRVARIKMPSDVPGEPAKYRHLGYFASEEEAARAYDGAGTTACPSTSPVMRTGVWLCGGLLGGLYY